MQLSEISDDDIRRDLTQIIDEYNGVYTHPSQVTLETLQDVRILSGRIKGEILKIIAQNSVKYRGFEVQRLLGAESWVMMNILKNLKIPTIRNRADDEIAEIIIYENKPNFTDPSNVLKIKAIYERVLAVYDPNAKKPVDDEIKIAYFDDDYMAALVSVIEADRVSRNEFIVTVDNEERSNFIELLIFAVSRLL